MTESMTDTEFRDHVVNMHLCLDMAVDVRALILEQERKADAANAPFVDLGIAAVLQVIHSHFPAPLVQRRREALAIAIAEGIRQYDTSVCLIWHLAHMLEHILYEEDLAEFH